ncbi:MAG: glycosyltransferase family 39 protein [Candidatus Limivivens sp.]|nr:glycosyltransferase family 39 protein [Candidatus Limivivens sp.]
MKENRLSQKKMDILIPLTLYILLLTYKLVVVIHLRSEPQVSDEFTYIKLARMLLTDGTYNSVQYPLLYPLYLMPAFLFGDHFYVAMKVLGAISSAFVPVCTYAIARLYLNPEKSMIPAAFSAVIPFHYVTTMTIMSENLYFPLFLLEIYLALRPRKRVTLCDIGYGALLGAMFMTRHITFVTIPVFLFVWLLRELEEKRSWKSIIGRGFLVVLSMCVVYAPWVWMCRSYGHGLKEIVGFKIASKTNPEQLTLKRLIMVAGFYICYFSLILAPVLGLLFKSIRALNLKKLFCSYNRLWVMVCGLAAAFFVAVTRHSWRAYYNYPDFEKIKGRYLIYFPILFVILGTVVLFREKPKFRKKWFNILVTYLLPVGMIIGAYLIDIGEVLMPLKSTFIGSIESTDGQKIKLIGPAFVVVVSLFLLYYQYLYDFAREERKKHLSLFFAVGLLLVEIWGMTDYLSYLIGVNDKQNQTNNRYAAELRETIEELELPEGTYIYAETMPEFKYVSRSLIFYQVDEVTLVQKRESIPGNEYYMITDDKDAFADITEEVAEVFNWKEKEFYLLKVQD